MKRKFIAILVVGLFVTLASTSMISAKPAYAGEEKVITILTGVDGKGIKGEKISLDQTTIDTLTVQITEFKTWIEGARPFQDFKITEDEKTEIITHVNNLLASVNLMLEENDLEPIDANWLYNEMFETELGRSTIVSVGIGYAFIPFYDYESFIGIMIRPMWLLYAPWFLGGGGYSGNLNINLLPPRIEYGDRLGGHIVRTTMFSGLYINIGDLGYDNMFGGPMILLGRARVVM